MNNSLKLFSALTFTFGLAACGGDDNSGIKLPIAMPTAEPTTIVDVAVANGSFTTLVAALQATGLDEVLDDADRDFTVFAPTDAAFELLGTDTINALLADTDTLSDILLYHVIADAEVDSTGAIAAAGTTVGMANEDSIGLSLSGENLLVNTAMVTMVDVEADNGIIHVIDAVLIPPADMGEPTHNIVETAVAAGSFTTLVTALQAAGLDSTLADETTTFTVFAPTDAAFAVLGDANIAALVGDTDALTEVLLQHVVSGAAIDSVTAYSANGTSVETASGAMIDVMIDGASLTIGGATVTTADIYTTNGVIHVIDAVILGDVALP